MSCTSHKVMVMFFALFCDRKRVSLHLDCFGDEKYFLFFPLCDSDISR